MSDATKTLFAVVEYELQSGRKPPPQYRLGPLFLTLDGLNQVYPGKPYVTLEASIQVDRGGSGGEGDGDGA